jgi:Uma2 family endonuclease
MSLHEIVLPETKPETEWVGGRALQKVSPKFSHGSLQGLLFMAFRSWAENGGHGRVATEWRFRIAPPGKIVRPLVPDVGYLSYAALAADAPDDLVEVPLGAPTVAVEVLSRGDKRADVADKIATYIEAGTAAVIVVDSRQERIAVHDRGGVRALGARDTLTHPSLPEFALAVGELFTRAKR